MNNLIIRAISGAVFAFLILGSIIFEHRAATGVLSIVMLIGLIEFYKLFKNHSIIDIDWRIGTAVGALLFGLAVCALYGKIPLVALWLVLPIVFLMLLTELWRKKKNPILNGAILIMGIIYIALPFFLLILINFFDQYFASFNYTDSFQFPLIAGMFLMIWANDTFAYLTGRMFGKTRLIERVSPNKTWEGTIGGIVFTIGVGCLFAFVINTPGYSPMFWIVSALIIAPCAIVGDLLESLLKRSLNIKDSGNIMPGHGGILDRFDATLFAIPFFVAWTSIYLYSLA
ncbi:MAG: phosphatidate cytidylyltransferase [Crocinitomicaceae bacterium]|nr:phosphatidate cytidylyltransferase [Crocinitomicaceae bacterium]